MTELLHHPKSEDPPKYEAELRSAAINIANTFKPEEAGDWFQMSWKGMPIEADLAQDSKRLDREAERMAHRFEDQEAPSRFIIRVALELLRRRNERRQSFKNSTEVWEYLCLELGENSLEEIGLLLLNGKHELIERRTVSLGGPSKSPYSARRVMNAIYETQAAAMIMYHNHPSGNPTPSRADREATEEVKRMCELVECNLLDHVVVASGGHYSIMQE